MNPVRQIGSRLLRTSAFFALGILVTQAQLPGVEHVVIVGCDGMGAVAFTKNDAPVMHRLMREGAWTLHARGVMPTVSSPNWASMIMGAGPEQHGVTSNDWEPDKFDIAPTAVGSGGIFPTIFGVLRDQRPAAQIVCIHDWDGFGRLLEPKAPNVLQHVPGTPATATRAIALFRERRPTFLFIHFDAVDHAGHTFGWKTPQYFQAVNQVDALIGRLLDTIRDTGLQEKTVVLVTGDHGGKGKKHGGNSMAELEIPWIIVGPGVAAGHEIKSFVNTCDTAATVAWIFGLKPPACWIGRPVREALLPDAANSH